MTQILKFRLTDNNIFEFKYSKYSEFIDNLEPEPEVIIDVLEPFTLEDFETAYLEYNKYVVFKNALKDIITIRKLWSKEELKEMLKYDLNNPVLEWLMIRETRDDKEIKETLSLDSLELKNIDKDDIILYYLVNKTNQIKFKCACFKNHLKMAQWLYSLEDTEKINIHLNNEEAFKLTCQYGHLEMAQWLYSLGDTEKINIYNNNEEAFKLTCRFGHLEIAQWLYSLKDTEKINIHHDNENAFKLSCKYGHLKMAQWLYSLEDSEKININIDKHYPFYISLNQGHLEVAQWLYSLEEFDKINHINQVFIVICKNGKLKMAQWIYSLGIINIENYELKRNVFLLVLIEKQYEILNWLISIGYETDNNDVIILVLSRDGHHEQLEWFLNLGVENPKFRGNISYENNFPFRWACKNGHLKNAKFLYEFSKKGYSEEERGQIIDIYSRNNEAFRFACQEGHFEIVEWLYNLYITSREILPKVLISLISECFLIVALKNNVQLTQYLHLLLDDLLENRFKKIDEPDLGFFPKSRKRYYSNTFEFCCQEGCLEVAQWLYSLGMIDFKEINLDNALLLKITSQPIKDWLATLE